MPGFISHTVMARDVYKKIDKDLVNIDYMETYSLGGDLSKYAKCRYDSHHKSQNEFIYTMADYIKNNNLVNDKELIGVLYGHICHYIMDSTIHPLVRKVDKTCLYNKHNHALIEEYYDKYLVNNIAKKSVSKYVRNKLLKARTCKKVSSIINYAYMEIYNTKNLSRYYKFNLFLYRNLRNIYGLFGDTFIYRITKLNRFLANNKDIEIENNSHKITYKDYHGIECSDSLMESYDTSIDRAVKYIDEINEYMGIYKNKHKHLTDK